MKVKGFKWLFGIYIVLFILDIVSTLLNYELLGYLEANPLFRLGGLLLPIFFNLLLLGFVWFVYNRYGVDARFYTLLIMVCVITTRIWAVYGNFQVFLNPPSIEYLQSLSAVELQAMRNVKVVELFFINTLPFLNAAMTWMFFRKDHEVIKK